MKCLAHPSDAVSPVVGVMLMLAVTVMIAAVVSTYAGGFSGSAEKSPQSSIRATTALHEHRIYFEHNGGDPFMLGSVSVVLRQHDNKTALSQADANRGIVRNFSEVGSSAAFSDSTIQAGDEFYIEAAEWGGDGAWMKFGSINITPDIQTTWLVIDRETGKTVSTGTISL